MSFEVLSTVEPTEKDELEVIEPKRPTFKTGFGLAPEREEEISRITTGLGREFVGGFLGLPGDLQQFLKNLIGAEKMPQIFPTAETIKEKIFKPYQQLTGISKEGVTEPKTELEARGRQSAELLGAFLSPIGGAPRALTAFLGSTIPVASQALAKKFGASEAVESIIGLITMFGTALATGKITKPAEAMKQFYKKATDLIPEGTEISAKSLTKNLGSIKESLQKGILVPSKAQPLRAVNQILRKVKDGKIPVDELIAAKRDVNELIKDPAMLKRGRTLLKGIAENVDKSIEQYGKTNPDFLVNYRLGNKLFGEMADTPKIVKFLNKKTDISKMDPITAGLLLFKPTLWIKALGIGKGLNFLDTILRKPAIRGLYFNSISKAAKGSTRGLAQTVSKLDKEIRKEKEAIPRREEAQFQVLEQ